MTDRRPRRMEDGVMAGNCFGCRWFRHLAVILQSSHVTRGFPSVARKQSCPDNSILNSFQLSTGSQINAHSSQSGGFSSSQNPNRIEINYSLMSRASLKVH